MELKQHRDSLSLTQREYAHVLGMSQVHVSRLERDLAVASLDQALEIERRTGYLVRAEDVPLKPSTQIALKRLRAQMRTPAVG
jgi:transcriptional regulator with XRE-family HTH domain